MGPHTSHFHILWVSDSNLIGYIVHNTTSGGEGNETMVTNVSLPVEIVLCSQSELMPEKWYPFYEPH